MVEIAYDYSGVPTIAAFAQSNARVRALTGPFASGKSSGSIVELVRRGQMHARSVDGIRHSRWAIVRNTYNELNQTTIKSLFQWFPPHYFGRYLENKHTYTIKAFPGCDIELIFLALDRPQDISKLLSLELTGGWINEVREVPWAIVEAMEGRIDRYPRRADIPGGHFWAGMWMDTNPPDSDSKFYRYFEEKAWLPDFLRLQREGKFPKTMRPEEYAAIFKQPSGLAANAENLSNLARGYYDKLAIGKSQEWVKIYVHGQYGFVVEGKLVYPEYGDKIHCQEVDPIEDCTIIRGWDFGLCYSDDTEVLTDSGWKLFKDVDENVDRAASRNPETGAMEFAPIAFKIAKPFKGDLLEWSSTELNMLVTPEHRVPFTFRDTPGKVHWESAQWLADHMTGHHYVDLVSTWEPETAPASICGLPREIFSAFMGLFLSEGTADGKVITIYQMKDKHRSEMVAILAATGWDWRSFEHTRNDRVVSAGWRLYDPDLSEMLAEGGNQHERRVPAIIRHLDQPALHAFVSAYTMGDGHIRQRPGHGEEHTIFTVSSVLAADLQEIAQKLGWNSSVRWRKPQTSTIVEDGVARDIVNCGGWAVTFKKTAKRAELLARNFKRVPYDGTVYCLNVPHHTLYVRRHGRPHWNGNTPACSFSQLLPDGRWLVFDEMTSDNMSIDQFSDEVLEHCRRAFRGSNVRFEDWGDPAGDQRVQTDKKTCFQIMQAKGIHIQGSIQDPTLRQESVRKTLRTLVAGEPQFILHPRCRMLRKGFMGGYHRRRMQTAGPERYTAEPEKNIYSHVADSLQYSMVQYFGADLTGDMYEDDDYPQGGAEDHAPRESTTGY